MPYILCFPCPHCGSQLWTYGSGDDEMIKEHMPECWGLKELAKQIAINLTPEEPKVHSSD